MYLALRSLLAFTTFTVEVVIREHAASLLVRPRPTLAKMIIVNVAATAVVGAANAQAKSGNCTYLTREFNM